MRIFGAIIEPPTEGLNSCITNRGQRGPVGPKPICNNQIRSAIAFHGALQKGERRTAIPPFRSKDLKHFAFVIDRTPEVKHLAVYPREHLVHVPAPVRIAPVRNAAFPDLGRKHRTETVPPVPYRLMADIDATLEQNVLDLAQ